MDWSRCEYRSLTNLGASESRYEVYRMVKPKAAKNNEEVRGLAHVSH